MPSRPLRALQLTIGGYIAVRASVLWLAVEAPVVTAVARNETTAMPSTVVAARPVPSTALAWPDIDRLTIPTPVAARPPRPVRLAIGPRSIDANVAVSTAGAMPGRSQHRSPPTATPEAALVLPPSTKLPAPSTRLSGSFWLLARTGSSRPLATGGQLGGSQAGMRLWYALDETFALTGRVSAPLSQAGREAAVGIAVRRGAFGAIVEKRFALDRDERNDVAALVFGGGEVALPLDLRLDAYAQAGVVGRDAFADGAVRVARTLHERGRLRLAAGAGVWGAAQPGVARIDVGPQLVATLPIASQRVRLSAEWRFRIAGDARPDSGPALTLGTDF